PPVPDLTSKDVQDYADGQLKWIIENGIGPSGMPGWKGILEDDEMWKIVRFIRHLPAKGSLGVPDIFKEEAEEHQAAEHAHGTPGHKHDEKKPHTHTH
ncbi:MAG TPA: cytochrome c, partial [Candidatus Angelobacter sp.]